MEPALIELFIQLIATQTGLSIRVQDYAGLAQKIKARVKALKLPNPQAYFNLLSADTVTSQQEWKQLIPLITTIESYFFRDQGQINLLRGVILPDLIASRQKTKTLTFWSAGCSTGEEPYTLSILLQQLLPDWTNWTINILGTDVNEEALQKARQGLYTSWSFRMVDPEIRNQYFSRQGQDWKINSKTQCSVQFFKLNLVKDLYCYPNYTAIQDVDLIVCRNVFVYFEKNYINQVVSKFHHVLKPGGYLITGHAELNHQDCIELFQSKIYPESMVYQKMIGLIEESVLSQKTGLTHHNQGEHLLSSSVQHQDSHLKIQQARSLGHLSETVKLPKRTLEEAKQYFQNKQYKTAIQKAEQFLQSSNPYLKSWELGNKNPEGGIKGQEDRIGSRNLKPETQFEAYYLLAQASANLGQYEQAIFYCKKALEIDSLSIFPYYLLLRIAQEQEDLAGAKLLSKRIIYLLPSSVPAYLELASIYEQEADYTRAVKMYSTALALLKSLPPSMGIEHLEGVTAQDLIAFLEKKRLVVDC
ncbi:Protein methyltransferase FrzF [Planktothrix tepida]|uniref:protein-glutamate O-methyltransferase n=2 Tax=Planktothrix TaxID=54304 RepID=A0A1J1LKD2_9CYAN|nr:MULTISPECIES: CheR family methyltransferase [Planktothrix]CAD5942132.1 Protein methyltransferase FrzF [Planktothrix tepida]CAD5969297.1 Protein methyltransferase FrzF [Planktothrix pseudagardhii]CUR33045.1 MCP methyltransferase CheR-type with Tpr repeat protein [Planktothrix tepida PCC 9214]